MNEIPEIEYLRFFYDYFSADDICGMFTPTHIAYIVLCFGLVILFLYASRNISDVQYRKIRLGFAIALTFMEIVKIALRVYKGQPPDDWIPFYYCGLFIFAIWFSVTDSKILSTVGNAYITMGAIMAGIIFTIYPSTSLALFPVWHLASIHAAIYHGAMIYLGVLTLMNQRYVPQKSHFRYYFCHISVVCVISIVLNRYLGTNYMFLDNPFGIPLLTELNEWCSPIYMIIAWFGQSTVLYWFNYGCYRLSEKRKKKNEGLIHPTNK